jgi:hypothetical protein
MFFHVDSNKIYLYRAFVNWAAFCIEETLFDRTQKRLRETLTLLVKEAGAIQLSSSEEEEEEDDDELDPSESEEEEEDGPEESPSGGVNSWRF